MKNPFQRNKRRFDALETRISFLEAAFLAFLEAPLYVDADNIGFNGQKARKEIYKFLCDAFHFEAMIETGTFTGNTTGYMAKLTGLPVTTCESNVVLAAVAKKRLAEFKHIDIHVTDSRDFLQTIIKTDIVSKRSFVYLDAHGYADLPLKQEIEIICRNWQEFVIMIDDFKVPGDPGYGYDDYGKGQALSMENFSTVIHQNGLVAFFPSTSSEKETGAKRGSVILAKKGTFAEQIAKCDLLVQSH